MVIHGNEEQCEIVLLQIQVNALLFVPNHIIKSDLTLRNIEKGMKECSAERANILLVIILVNF